MSRRIIIGSRGSELALWQAEHVRAQLQGLNQDAEIKVIRTQGDRIQNLSFDKLEGKGFFTKELEEELLSSEIDLAVHSHKDLPTESPEGLIIAAVSVREDPSDLLLMRKDRADTSRKFHLTRKAVVGTSSARRKSQLLHHVPDIQLRDLRGNVPTRVNKLREAEYDAIVLASAGVARLQLDLSDLHTVALDPQEFIPAPAQGVLALQTRESDTGLASVLSKLSNTEVAERIHVERRILQLFEGGCQMPLGAYCEKEGDELIVRACVAATWNSPVRYAMQIGKDGDDLARAIVSRLKQH